MFYEVRDKATRELFLSVPKILHKKDPNYISPLDKDIEAVFDPKKNNFHKHGICCRWVLHNGDRISGRIAAFIDFDKNKDPYKIIGGIGFFESIDVKSNAFLLFNIAKSWLKEQGAIGMVGPINFGENDKYWGLLIDGFVKPGLGMNYNPDYYERFFDLFGFKKEYDQYTNVIHLDQPFPDRFAKIADWVSNKPEYSFVHFQSSKFKKFAHDFQEIYNDAWSDFDNFTPIEYATIKQSFREMKPIVDEKIIWFAYHGAEPIGFVLALPDINILLQRFKGKMNLFNKLRFLFLKNTTTIDRVRFIVMGCKKKFQNKGIESGMIRKLQQEVVPRNTIKEAELAWVGDFNTKMIAIHEATGAVREKVHRTYKIMF